MLQNIFELVSPYIGDILIGVGAFFGVRVSLSQKKTKEEKTALKKANKLAKAKKRASKLSSKLSSCVQFLQSQVDEKERDDGNGDSSNE